MPVKVYGERKGDWLGEIDLGSQETPAAKKNDTINLSTGEGYRALGDSPVGTGNAIDPAYWARDLANDYPPKHQTIEIPSSAFALVECPQDAEALAYMLARDAKPSAVGRYPTPRHVARTAEANHVWELKADDVLVKLSGEPKYYTPNLVAEQVIGTLADPFYWSFYPDAESSGYKWRCAGVDSNGYGIAVEYEAPPASQIKTEYASATLLKASTESSRGVGAIWNAGEYQYQEAIVGSTYADFATDGGVLLMLMPLNGVYNAGGLPLIDYDDAGGDTADNTFYLQRVIDLSYMGDLFGGRPKGEAKWPEGTFRTLDTIHVGYGLNTGTGDTTTTPFQSIYLSGAGEANAGNTHNRGTTIYCDFDDRQGINLQGGRGSVVGGFTVEGLLGDWINTNDLGEGDGPLNDLDPDNWDDTTNHSIQDSRYAPYAGITIDAFYGVKPVGGYPDMTYPAVLGTSTQYGKSPSSRVYIHNVEFRGFNTACCQQPCDADGNADFTEIVRPIVRRCKYGFSVGNTQGRVMTIHKPTIAHVFTAFTNNKHGAQGGTFGGTITDSAYDSLINIIDFTATGQPGGIGATKFQGFHGEGIWRIGNISGGGGPNDARVVFENGNFNFGAQDVDHLGIPASVLSGGPGAAIAGDAHIEFLGVQFSSYNSHIYFDCDPQALSFKACQSSVTSASITQPYQRAAQNCTLGGLVFKNGGRPNITDGDNPSITEHRARCYDVDTGISTKYKVGPHDYRGRNIGCSPYLKTIGPRYYQSSTPLIKPVAAKFDDGDLSSSTLADRIWSFTFTSRGEDDFAQEGPDVGDVLIDKTSGYTFVVKTRTGTTATAEMVTGYKSDGSGGFVMLAIADSAGVKANFDPASFDVNVIVSRYYAPAYPLWGDSQTSSADMANVGDDDGTTTRIESEIVVGDSLAINRDEFRPYTESNSEIAARSNANGSITFSGAGRYNRGHIPLMQFIRQAVADGV